jgi:hypothetical protein
MQLKSERESGKFSYLEYTDYLLQQFGLSELINNPNLDRPVKVTVIFDGGSLCRFLGHFTGGYKLVDPSLGLETRRQVNYCLAILAQLNRTEFADFFRFLKEYERHHHHRIKYIFPQDVSLIWKTTGCGCFRGHRCVQPRCYHHPMLSQEAMEAWLELEGEYTYLLNPSPELKKSLIFLSLIDALRDERNP